MIEVIPIPYEDKYVLHQLLQFYRYDSSEYDGHKLTQHGLYMYKYLDHQWTEDYRSPFFIKVDGELAGFALIIRDVPAEFVALSTASESHVVSDFFVMRKFRGQGVGKHAAFTLFDQFPGVWEVRQSLGNTPANKFWMKTIHAYTNGCFIEEVIHNDRWKGPVQVFESKTRDANS
ncbi:GNAT family N-acetyltransferase [Paenibacillus sp. N1-5-1-14]|nr:GNAT family N-acetyltransferase [Paenibacillus radicibacter]MCR8644402.1 GNAT family N-acetyltransferase [Paenibacillus radicibacter]